MYIHNKAVLRKDKLNSYHMPSVAKIDLNSIYKVITPWPKYKKTDWVKYKENLHKNINLNIKIDTTEEIE